MIGGRGFAGDAQVPARLDAALFGEAQGRIVISFAPDAEGRVAELARESGMMTLFESGCLAVERGMTSLEEVVRVLGIPHGD